MNLEEFKQKFPALVFVSAHAEKRNKIEYFHFYRAQLMRKTSQTLLAELFKTGSLLVDLRLHGKETSARNHGTGFRVFDNKLPLLFQRIEDI